MFSQILRPGLTAHWLASELHPRGPLTGVPVPRGFSVADLSAAWKCLYQYGVLAVVWM